MNFELPKLKFKNDDLMPFISSKTLEYHYGKHHQAYINNLNDLKKDGNFENATLEDIIKNANGALFNNAAQVYNHNFYWKVLNISGPKAPTDKFNSLLAKNNIEFATLQEQFGKAALTLFGSGWVWLALNNENKLEIKSYSNAGNPLLDGLKPILTLDVWEHAYYIDYFNNRKAYIENFWKYVDWNYVDTLI